MASAVAGDFLDTECFEELFPNDGVVSVTSANGDVADHVTVSDAHTAMTGDLALAAGIIRPRLDNYDPVSADLQDDRSLETQVETPPRMLVAATDCVEPAGTREYRFEIDAPASISALVGGDIHALSASLVKADGSHSLLMQAQLGLAGRIAPAAAGQLSLFVVNNGNTTECVSASVVSWDLLPDVEIRFAFAPDGFPSVEVDVSHSLVYGDLQLNLVTIRDGLMEVAVSDDGDGADAISSDRVFTGYLPTELITDRAICSAIAFVSDGIRQDIGTAGGFCTDRIFMNEFD
jgi:hypothetical protein